MSNWALKSDSAAQFGRSHSRYYYRLRVVQLSEALRRAILRPPPSRRSCGIVKQYTAIYLLSLV